MIPFIRNSPIHTLNIPEMSGGVNLRDSLTLVNDNQLTECKNMWFKDGMLKTRPKIVSDVSNDNFLEIDIGKDWFGCGVSITNYPKNATIVDGREYFLQIIKSEKGSYWGSIGYTTLYFRYISIQDDTKIIDIGNIETGGHLISDDLLTFQHNGDIYCFIDVGNLLEIIKFERVGEGLYSEPKHLTPEDMYAPLVAINCLPSNENAFTGTLINGYNLIGAYFNVEYSTVNPDVVDPWGDGTLHRMSYISPAYSIIAEKDYPLYKGLTVTAKLTDENGNISTHKVVLGENGFGRESLGAGHPDELIMEASPVDIVFFIDDETGSNEAKVREGDVQIRNNLEITFPTPKPYGSDKVYKMTKAEWFGGAAQGLYGGSRLFLTGNTSEEEKALVVWSDLNEPLYFSENNYAYVGDKSQAVTGFGKQSDSLVIFKEKEIYQTKYVASEAPTAEEVINQSAIDLSTLSAYFPFTQINGVIGCDCPNTIQLCRNRLVWTNSDGKVYSLVSQNQYNERSVFAISEMIERSLKNESDLKSAYALDCDGYYALFDKNKVYLMDYNSYGYNYVSSYSKSEDANKLIPWYIWELPFEAKGGFFVAGKIAFTRTTDVFLRDDDNLYGGKFGVYISVLGAFGGNDELCEYSYNNGWEKNMVQKPIQSSITTKLFDFGQPARLKSVPIVNISFGDNEGRPITVDFISEKNIKDQHSVNLIGANEEIYSPGYSNSVRFFPWTKGSVKFGINISCDGELSIDAITLQYKTLGGAK